MLRGAHVAESWRKERCMGEPSDGTGPKKQLAAAKPSQAPDPPGLENAIVAEHLTTVAIR